MTSYEDVTRAVRIAPSPTQGRVHFAALLAGAAEVDPDDFIVVGGSAIEFHTVGEYTSGDIDIVSSRSDALRTVLHQWKFTGGPRVWLNEDLGIVVDLVKYPYTGDLARTQVYTTPYGMIRVAGIEDLLVKRLASAKHWKIPGDVEHAKLLALLYGDRLDWDYVRKFAALHDVEDFLEALLRAIERG
jgi:hypothetical protein